MMVQACNVSTREGEGQGHPCLYSMYEACLGYMRPYLKRREGLLYLYLISAYLYAGHLLVTIYGCGERYSPIILLSC